MAGPPRYRGWRAALHRLTKKEPVDPLESRRMSIVLWGTCDTGKPRVRILRDGLKMNGVNVLECCVDIWGGISDKSQIGGLGRWMLIMIRAISSYPALIYRYLRLPKHDWVLLCYPAIIDAFVIYPFAKLRRAKIAMDWFLSAYDTVVLDRQMVSPRHPIAWSIRAIEWGAIRLADRLFMDTNTHAQRMERLFRLTPGTCGTVWVGVEEDIFQSISPITSSTESANCLRVLFYGQFIPLHGISTIIEAATLLEREPVEWTIIGCGQEADKIREMLNKHPLKNVQWIDWVKYEELADYIRNCDICLGIFGTSEKAASVIPNKVYQAISTGRAVITRDSPAIRELLNSDSWKHALVPPNDPKALATAIQRHSEAKIPITSGDLASAKLFGRAAIGQQLITLLESDRKFPGRI